MWPFRVGLRNPCVYQLRRPGKLFTARQFMRIRKFSIILTSLVTGLNGNRILLKKVIAEKFIAENYKIPDRNH